MNTPRAPFLALPLALAVPARAEAPLSYLRSYGTRAAETEPLLRGLLALSIFVSLLIAGLVLVGVLRARGGRLGEGPPWPVGRDAPGAVGWIYAGLVLTVPTLLGFTVWTVTTMAAIRAPGSEPTVTILLTAHQWWWEARYIGPDPAREFETANELHIPVGAPVRLRLASADVIHSFWVPALAGKTDLIPGQENETWIRADVPGVFRGQCAEYCGLEHARMGLRVFADPPEAFAAWWEAELAPAPRPSGVAAGEAAFVLHCGACHAVRGTEAGGDFGPDLSHLMARTTLAAASLPMTLGHLSGWIADPGQLKPGTTMPRPDLSGPELATIRTFLATLR